VPARSWGGVGSAKTVVEADSRVTTRNNLRIVFLCREGREFPAPITDSWGRFRMPQTASRDTKSAGKCGQIYGAPITNCDRRARIQKGI
jgi:hypothetical protein